MGSAKHTPGPWSVNSESTNDFIVQTGDKRVYEAEDYSGVVGVAEVRSWGGVPPRAEAEANAALIAAAPDMAEALQMLAFERHGHVAGAAGQIDTCARCGQDIRHGAHYRVGESRETDLARARAALKKAGVL